MPPGRAYPQPIRASPPPPRAFLPASSPAASALFVRPTRYRPTSPWQFLAVLASLKRQYVPEGFLHFHFPRESEYRHRPLSYGVVHLASPRIARRLLQQRPPSTSSTSTSAYGASSSSPSSSSAFVRVRGLDAKAMLRYDETSRLGLRDLAPLVGLTVSAGLELPGEQVRDPAGDEGRGGDRDGGDAHVAPGGSTDHRDGAPAPKRGKAWMEVKLERSRGLAPARTSRNA